jgi:tetratricopeptide (TPR) repeat protein
MDRTFINNLLQLKDEDFNNQVLYVLKRTMEKYPFFSLLYYYNAKCAKSLSQNPNQALSLASTYSPDRARLKEFMETNIAFQFTSEEAPKTDMDKINERIEQLKKLYGTNPTHKEKEKDTTPDIIKEIDSYAEPNLSTTPTKEELVERFLHIENPKLKNLKDEKESVSINEVVKKSVEQEFEIVTETMAKVYLKQGYKDRAIKIYQQLILANPEKSSYFANQIQKIVDNN